MATYNPNCVLLSSEWGLWARSCKESRETQQCIATEVGCFNRGLQFIFTFFVEKWQMANWLGKMFKNRHSAQPGGQPGDQPAAPSRVWPWRLLSRRARSSFRLLAWSAPAVSGDISQSLSGRSSVQRGSFIKQRETYFILFHYVNCTPSFLFCILFWKMKGLLILPTSICLLKPSQRIAPVDVQKVFSKVTEIVTLYPLHPLPPHMGYICLHIFYLCHCHSFILSKIKPT